MSLGGEGGLCFDGRAARGHAADATNVREVETELVHSIDVMRLVFAGFKDLFDRFASRSAFLWCSEMD